MPPKDPIDAVLGPGGLLARATPGYEHRPQQIEMAKRVRAALSDRHYALIEAGTGTGKTLAYLLPAALSGRRVVVSTATKTLQEQIITKDLPLLQQTLGLDLVATVMKGRSNYLCLARLEKADHNPRFTLASKDEVRAYAAIARWAARTETGDRSELDLPENLGVWKELTATSETCSGQRCELYEECFVTRMRRRAAESDLIIVNHHLFFADLALKTSPSGAGGAEVIPRYDAVVFDEAHALEDVATSFFGVEASDYRVSDLIHDSERELFDIELSVDLRRSLELLGHRSQAFFAQVKRLLPAPSSQALRLLPSATAGLKQAAEDVREALKGLAAQVAGLDEPEPQALARRAQELAADLSFLVEAREPSFVFWAESRARAVYLRAAPIDVAEQLRERLYAHVDTLVFTSATLATQGNLSFLKRRLGLTADETGEDRYLVDGLVLDSPFDYATQAALYVPVHLPEPNDPRFVEQAAEEIRALCELTGGRAFALFTSVRNMTEAHDLLKDRLPFQVLLQGERPKQALIEAFRTRPSVLFATHSFWEGVDIAGQALSLVIIDKLPFASPADPVVAARVDLLRTRGEEPFTSYQVPQAALALRQGFGRLIRTRRDRGIVAILDRRLATKRYGRAFLESLPNCPRTAEREQIAAWWKGRVGV